MAEITRKTKSSFDRNRLRASISLVWLLIIFLDVGRASADIGPKPTIDFNFIYEIRPVLTILDGELLECIDENCLSAQPLKTFGAQGFKCDKDSCTSMSYGYPDFMRLRIRFSDGVTRQSNVFHIETFTSSCTVIVSEMDLTVRQDKILSWLRSQGIWLLFLLSAFFPFVLGIILVIFVGLLFWLGVKVGRGQSAFGEAKTLYLLTWSISGVLLFLGSMITFALPITILIEIGVAAIYSRLTKHDWLPLLTAVIVVNLFTQPALWFSIQELNTAEYGLFIFIFELIVCIVEAILLKLALRCSMIYDDALVLSVLMNTASYFLGLLLTIR